MHISILYQKLNLKFKIINEYLEIIPIYNKFKVKIYFKLIIRTNFYKTQKKKKKNNFFFTEQILYLAKKFCEILKKIFFFFFLQVVLRLIEFAWYRGITVY